MISTNMIAEPPTHITAPPMCTSSTGLGPQVRWRMPDVTGNGSLEYEPRATPVNASTGMAMNRKISRTG